MRTQLIILFMMLAIPLSLKAETGDIRIIRELFYLGVEEEDAVTRLEEFITSKYSADILKYPPLILAYKGGVEALKAKHAFSPFSKFSYLMTSLDLLGQAVQKLPDDMEIRFIRFSILDNIPSFFGYGEERTSDKNKLIIKLLKNDFSRIDIETQKGMIEYLMNSSNLSDDEKDLLKEKCIAVNNQ